MTWSYRSRSHMKPKHRPGLLFALPFNRRCWTFSPRSCDEKNKNKTKHKKKNNPPKKSQRRTFNGCIICAQTSLCPSTTHMTALIQLHHSSRKKKKKYNSGGWREARRAAKKNRLIITSACTTWAAKSYLGHNITEAALNLEGKKGKGKKKEGEASPHSGRPSAAPVRKHFLSHSEKGILLFSRNSNFLPAWN